MMRKIEAPAVVAMAPMRPLRSEITPPTGARMTAFRALSVAMFSAASACCTCACDTDGPSRAARTAACAVRSLDVASSSAPCVADPDWRRDWVRRRAAADCSPLASVLSIWLSAWPTAARARASSAWAWTS